MVQDVVTVGGNGKGTAPVVTAVKTFELAGNKTRLVHSASGSEGSMGSAVARAVASGVAAGVPAAVAQVIANRADGERITVSNSNSSSRDCQEFCAVGHDDEKERIITWLSRKNFWTSSWR
ncbi:hypothetical protein, partial [Sinorhizobium medicae]|uniref:hypothetical protein n=1 Tax=Sinorhizobium medicae TaxID=110321 RepID=UPI0019119352